MNILFVNNNPFNPVAGNRTFTELLKNLYNIDK